MNTLNYLSLMEWNSVLLQSVNSSFQMNLILYLSIAIVILTVAVLIYVYWALQVVLQASGIDTEETLTIDWVNYLYILTIGLGLISVYVFYSFV